MIDLRSDTVTQPTPAMREAMLTAALGDDVYGDDPTVNDLEHFAAETYGFEAALFASSGTQTNLLALMSHCQRGDEYIVGHDAHTYKYEGGGAAVLGSIQPQPVPFSPNGELDLDKVAEVIKPDNVHFARTRLLCLENTYHGNVVPMDYLPKARETAKVHGLAFHLDGARVFHAATYHRVNVTEILHHFDSVSICLSKGLCAPVGSLLLGKQSLITEARKWRKMLGGGMRQAGILAAAGKIALTEMTQRLQDDHDKAAQLAQLLERIAGLEVRKTSLQTNMVWCDFSQPIGNELGNFAKTHGILISPSAREMRLVLHHDISSDDIVQTAQVLQQYFAQQ